MIQNEFFSKDMIVFEENLFKIVRQPVIKLIWLKSYLNRKELDELKPFKCLNNECDSSFVTYNQLKSNINWVHMKHKMFRCVLNTCENIFKKIPLNNW